MLSAEKCEVIEDTIRKSLRGKFEKYDPKAMAKPFHTRLLGKDRLALYSFMHSLITTFGESVFEPVGMELARGRFETVKKGRVGTLIHKSADDEINRIVNGLGAATLDPNAAKEIQAIREAVRCGGETCSVELRMADLWLENPDGTVVLVEMKTVKPNISGFEDHKRQLLRWIAAVLHNRPDANVSAIVGLPYNPYAPADYKWWTMRSMYDLQEQVKVAEGFWNFLAGDNIYDELLNCFEQVGVEMREEIDAYFKRFK